MRGGFADTIDPPGFCWVEDTADARGALPLADWPLAAGSGSVAENLVWSVLGDGHRKISVSLRYPWRQPVKSELC